MANAEVTASEEAAEPDDAGLADKTSWRWSSRCGAKVRGIPRVDGLVQLDGYLAGLGLDTGWLVIFDRRSGQPPISERTTTENAVTRA